MTSPIKTDLKIDWATYEATKFACMNWHYSKCVPKSKLAKFGVWENNKFIGVVVFGIGATSDLVKSYGLTAQQGCELVRIALTSHVTPVSRIVAICLRLLKKTFQGLRLVVSFSDPENGHYGGIYQAGGWFFSGNSQASAEYIYKGKRWHGRSFRHTHKGMEKHPDVNVVMGSSKHRYLMPLDAEMRRQIEPLAKPYPKRTKEQDAENPSALGGATPTRALHSTPVNP